jgi:Lon protease-like protein
MRGGGLRELSLFPLPLVLFPDALQIFEFRYRIMMHSVLKTDLRFGVIFVGAGGASDVGCVREVAEHERLAEDRFILISGAVSCRPQQVLPRCQFATMEWLENRRPGECWATRYMEIVCNFVSYSV